MKGEAWKGYLFISPWLVGFALLVAVPFVASIYLAFTRYNIISAPEWIGLANYKRLFTEDPLFWKSLVVTLKYAVIAVPLGIVVGVGLALLLNLDIRGIRLYRTVFYLPSIVPTVASCAVFSWVLNPQIGLMNSLLRRVGVEGPAWLTAEPWAFYSLVLMSLWSIGGSMIIYLAGLKNVPAELYEAAVVDGANAWQRTVHITLPMLTPVIFFNLVMGVINAFQYFTQAYIMTQGGPEDSTSFYALYLFKRSWRYLDMGYASAMAWILFVLIMAITGILFKTHKRWVHYGR
ncbi:L-arabinose transport system permease protein AraP [Pontiella desulfatans]|uniref:L-arabinose transport system permease protein AraP n=1 Tax=Pontiella desulfatans TaxID=2750659 RepID=A0A6C2U494_PONDE|nr:sugar ABC transporter permease [Pontiella desulfatans]VGO14649.1 L-arabinose transport system permease protein AraP [Pontiella desulfatans]